METLYKFKQFVDEITKENSRNYKLSVLEKYKDDEDIRYYLHFLLNPYITTGVSEKKLTKQLPKIDFNTNSNSVEHILHWLSKNNTGTDHIIKILQAYLNNTEYKEFLFALFTKNLKLGVDSKTVNKVMPGLVPEFSIQLANKYFDDPSKVEGKDFTLTTKIDGGRIIAIKKNGKAKFYTRQGQEYEGLVDLKAEMEEHMPDNICLDGEITLLNPGLLVSKDQYKQTMKITRADGEKHGVKMIVFDIMTADEFEVQKSTTPYSNRKLLLNNLFTKYSYKYFTRIHEWYTGTDTSVIVPMLNKAINNGEEGLMININDATYQFTRTNDLLKVKKMKDVDLEVIGFEEGTNRHKGRLGALLCNYNGNTLHVGSGLSDELRTAIWNNQAEWLGRTIVVQYFEETTNADGGKSLRFPVYIDYRTDK